MISWGRSNTQSYQKPSKWAGAILCQNFAKGSRIVLVAVSGLDRYPAIFEEQMYGPRLTEERLRNFLDGDQPARERMCLALLPVLGPFTESKARRPKGGRDGGRDIECLYKGVETWGAVGFRNGGGRDEAARKSAQQKFRDDLRSAKKANPELTSFVFFTNVDLTPDQKAALIAYAEKVEVKAQVFDLEVLRHALDTPVGVHIRDAYLGTSPNEDWKPLQASKISSYTMVFRFPKRQDGGADESASDNFTEAVGVILAKSFGHVCTTSPFDDFTFILSVEESDHDTEVEFISLTVSLHCHITAFVWAFQELCQYYIEGSTDQVSARMRRLPGTQTIDIQSKFDDFVPYRIFRSGATQISIHQMAGKSVPLTRDVTTSTMLRFLAAAQSGKVLLWDNADQCPDLEKVVDTMGRINDAGHFEWDNFHIDREDPERWEFIGDR